MKDILAKLAALDNASPKGRKAITESQAPQGAKYPDTKQGAIACLMAEGLASWVKTLDLPNCKVSQDPSVQGVWAIDSPAARQRVIVYLGGYRDPWGQIRDYDDFEVGDLPASATRESMEVDEAINSDGDREYTSWHGWKSACRKAYPGCGFRGDRSIASATLGPVDVGDWDGSVGIVYPNAEVSAKVSGEEQFNPRNFGEPVAEGGQPTESDPYTLGMGYYSRQLRKEPEPKNPHPAGSGDYKRWQSEFDLGRQDRYRERSESVEPSGNAKLDEISDDTIRSYRTKANMSANGAAVRGNTSTFKKRVAGIERANKRVPEEPRTFDYGNDIQKSYYSDKPGSRYVGDSVIPKNTKAFVIEGVKFRVSDPKVAKILRRFPHEALKVDAGGELDDHLFDALYDYYLANGAMPYGIAKAKDGDPYDWVSDKLQSELQSHHAMESLDEGIDGLDPEIQEIFDKYPHEAKLFNETGELDDGPMFEELFDHFSNNGEMPYGIAKARDGDPVQWIADHLSSTGFGHPADAHDFVEGLGGDIMPMEGMGEDSVDPTPEPGEEVIVEEPLMNQEETVSILQDLGLDEGLDFFFEGEDLIVIGRSTARLVINKIGGHIQSIDGEEVRIGAGPKERPVASAADVNQLAAVDSDVDEAVDSYDDRNASKIMARVDELQRAIDGIEQERAEWVRRGYDTSELDMDISSYKSEIEELLGDLEPNSLEESASITVQSDCEDELLAVIRKLSGLPEAGQTEKSVVAVVEPDIEMGEAVGDDQQYQNEPDPTVHTDTTQMMNMGGDLNRPKRQYPGVANRAANPLGGQK